MDSRRGRFNSMRFQPGFRYGASTAVIGALALLTGETQGFAIDATAYATAAAPYTGGPAGGTVAVIDTGTPANDLSNVALDSSNLTQSGTSPKIVHFPDSPYARWTPHNYILQSQTFGTTWVATSTVTENDTTAPDGTATVDKVVDGSGTQVKQTAVTTLASVVYTASLYVKQSNITWFSFIVNSDDAFTDYLQCWFNVSAGSTGASSANGAYTYVTHSITAADNGFYRLSITYSTTAINQGFFLCSVTADSGSTRVSSGTYWLWGAQINRGNTTLPYLATTTAARIGIPQGYDTAASKYGILVEPAATNVLLQTEDFTNVKWTNESSTDTGNSTTAPDGATTADTLTAVAANVPHDIYFSDGVATSAVNYTLSVYAKAGTASYLLVNNASDATSWAGAIFDLANGTVTQTDAQTITLVDTSIVSVGNGWYRCSVTATLTATVWYPIFGISNSGTATQADGDYGKITFNAAGTETLYLWGAQLETGTVATSYIPTLGSTVTRAVDKITALTSTMPNLDTAHTVYCDCRPRSLRLDGAIGYYWEIQEDVNNRTVVYADPSSGPGPRQFCQDGGAPQCDTDLGSYTLGTRSQVSAAFAANDFDGSVDGGAVQSDATGTMPGTLDTFAIGMDHDVFSGHGNFVFYRFVVVPRQVETASGNLATWRYNF
jgi:hypothetical protein